LSGNRVGTAYALTTFARILPGKADELEAYLGSMPKGPESPFARLGMLHIARVQIFMADLSLLSGAPTVTFSTPIHNRVL